MVLLVIANALVLPLLKLLMGSCTRDGGKQAVGSPTLNSFAAL